MTISISSITTKNNIEPKVVGELSMVYGFPYADNEPADIDIYKCIYEYSNELYMYKGGDGWEIAIDGIDYNNRDIFSVRGE